MQNSLNIARVPSQQWIYASLTVVDGDRRIKPAQVGFDRLIFREPPHLTSSQVEIILVNGDEEDRHIAAVLPHDGDATQIPIRLISYTTKK